jgi:hypothetical protein
LAIVALVAGVFFAAAFAGLDFLAGPAFLAGLDFFAGVTFRAASGCFRVSRCAMAAAYWSAGHRSPIPQKAVRVLQGLACLPSFRRFSVVSLQGWLVLVPCPPLPLA